MPLTLQNFSYATFLSVDFGGSTGSGFRLSCFNKEYLITAKHVVFEKIYDIYGKIVSHKPRLNIAITSQNSLGNRAYAYEADVDLAKSKIKLFGDSDLCLIELEGGKNYTVNNSGYQITVADENDLLQLDSISIASQILIVGFPSSLLNPEIFDVQRPLLRTGIVAGINEANKTFIIDSPAFYGNSGGAVIQITDNNLHIIGVVSKYIPFVTEWFNTREKEFSRQEFYNSGYAICEPLDEIIDYLKP